MPLIVGISGATGSIYGIRLLEVLRQAKVETHLIISKTGEQIIEHETTYKVSEVRKLASFCYDIDDLSACISSGSFLRDGMVVAPCSMKTMSAIAYSIADNLLVRAADVTLKERKNLTLLARETPLHQGHLRNMLRLAEMGAIILPPVPSFYHRPKTIDDIVDHTVAKILDLQAIKHNLSRRWAGFEQ
ncbi:MAG: UbiX family flavin prenyltransferase [Chloroflexota bacterium]